MNIKRALFAAAPPIAAAVIGGLGSKDAAKVYPRLKKPSWAPPASVFGPAWTALYATIGVAGWRIYDRGSHTSQGLHLAQVAVNSAWPALFFTVKDKRASLAVIGILDALVAAELWSLRKSDPGSVALLTPYADWLGFATALNGAVAEPT